MNMEHNVDNVIWILAFIAFVTVVNCNLVYYGNVKESAKNGDKVELDKPLYVRNRNKFPGAEVCGYTIHKALDNLPFRVTMLESFSGGAAIVVEGKLDFEKQQKYSFQVSAHDCQDLLNMTHSERDTIEITVEDVNDNRPRWVDSSYDVTVTDVTKKHAQVVCLQVTDDDSSKSFSDICRFFLSDSSELFYVDEKGCIYNKEVIVGPRSVKTSYYLKVFAEDCGGLVSEGLDVHVRWIPTCTFFWKGYERNFELFNFAGNNSTSLPLLRNAKLDDCNRGDTCKVASLSVTLKLTSVADGGCRRDSNSIEAQRALCGLEEDSSYDVLIRNETEFDGNSTYLEIPTSRARVAGRFMVTVWIKRNGSSQGKEQILCNSDDSNVIRRHYMWYVDGCRMVFVVRRSDGGEEDEADGAGDDSDGDNDESGDSSNGSRGGQKKVESQWEWAVKESCDGKWHHYAVGSSLSDEMSTNVDLYVDGRVFATSKNNLKIVRKWKLHHLSHAPNPRVVVGACWMGRHQRMEEHFRGWLAGLTVVTNQTNSDQVIKCLSHCHERLALEKFDDTSTETFVLLSESMNQMTVNSTSPAVVQKVISQVNLLIPSPHPDPGQRVVSMTTDVVCGNSQVISFDSSDIVVTVSKPRPLTILTDQVVRVEESALLKGVDFLEEFRFQNSEMESENLDVETCFVRSDVTMDLNNEMFLFTNHILQDLDLQVDLTNRGMFVGKVGDGSKNISFYEHFLKTLKYVNRMRLPWQQKSFFIGCLDSSEHLVTNQAKVTVIVSEPEPVARHDGDMMMKSDLALERPVIRKEAVQLDGSSATSVGFWLPVFLVVCAGLVITLGIMGVSKLRDRRGEQHADMEWDHSEMSIAVNPLYEMDDLNSADQSEIFDEREDDEDFDSGNGDEGNPSEETRRDLEWDDLPY